MVHCIMREFLWGVFSQYIINHKLLWIQGKMLKVASFMNKSYIIYFMIIVTFRLKGTFYKMFDANSNVLDPKIASFGGDLARVLNLILILPKNYIFWLTLSEDTVPSLASYQKFMEKYLRLWECIFICKFMDDGI